MNIMENSESMRQNNWPLWTGALTLVLAFVVGVVPFVAQLPGQSALPWLDLLLSILAVAVVISGLRRAIRDPNRYRGKVAGWILAALSSLLLVFSAFAFYVARQIPQASVAPRIGQKAPDFELRDTGGRNISLAQLLISPLDGSRDGPRPKAVLLVFYRGYW
jgi:hypothetical protein